MCLNLEAGLIPQTGFPQYGFLLCDWMIAAEHKVEHVINQQQQWINAPGKRVRKKEWGLNFSKIDNFT